ncbi:MAG: hypothetical protein LBJ59_11565 [Zoogloeaceae bacterium]|nr:hypothetical protein [Zoogloeaceae bacterium]
MLILCLLSSVSATAQTPPPELPQGTPEPIRRDMEIIQNYSNEVNRMSRRNTADNDAANEARRQAEATGFTPLVIAPPKTSITPDAPNRLIDTLERDPFEVSPQLREGGRNRRVSQAEGVSISRNLRLRALARGNSGGVAQIQSGREILTVHDGDELDVDGIRYTVRVEPDGLVLRGAGAPQYRMLVR